MYANEGTRDRCKDKFFKKFREREVKNLLLFYTT